MYSVVPMVNPILHIWKLQTLNHGTLYQNLIKYYLLTNIIG